METTAENNIRKDAETTEAWYVMRDLKRPNALHPAYKMLEDLGFQVFTPLIQKVVRCGGGCRVREMPAIQDLLFVYSTKMRLDPVTLATRTLQYRYVKGGAYKEAMTVPTADMERFIAAVSSTPWPQYYAISEITPNMVGRKVRIHGGPLDGIEANVLNVRGARKKRIIVELPLLIAAVVEVTEADYIETVTLEKKVNNQTYKR